MGMDSFDFNNVCEAGYYCLAGAYSMTPGNHWIWPSSWTDPTGAMCPKGHYCGAGSTRPLTCKAGTYMPSRMAQSPESCLQCPPGQYCEQDGIFDLTDRFCDEGYYCKEGASSPKQLACGYDFFCKKGTLAPVACLPEAYTRTDKSP